MRLKAGIAGIELEHPIMSAPPNCKTPEDVEKLLLTPVAAIVVGSVTWEARSGNKGEVLFSRPGEHSVNSLGMPNGGQSYYRTHLPKMVRAAHEAGKKLLVNVAGFTPEEYALLTMLAIEGGADGVELNCGCPNVWDGGKQKDIVAYDPGLLDEVLRFVEDAVEFDVNPDRPIALAVKISPYSTTLLPTDERVRVSPPSTDPLLLEKIAKVILRHHLVGAVTATNTVPNALVLQDDGTPAIKSPDVPSGVGGLAGRAIKEVALEQVRRLRQLLPPHIDVIGVGGISTGQDADDYLQAGASAVQIATAIIDSGPRVIDTILAQLVDIQVKETASA